MRSRSQERGPVDRLPALTIAGATIATLLAASGVTASAASWTDEEWDGAALGALDCAAPAIGTSTGTGKLLGGTLLGVDLDDVAGVRGVTVDNDGHTATVSPATAEPVGPDAYRDPLVASAVFDAINVDFGDTFVLPLGTGTGSYGQYARASDDAGSAGASGLITEDGGIDLDGIRTPPPDERPEFGILELGTVLEEATGVELASIVTDGLTDLHLGIGAVASAAVLDGCDAAWTDDVYSSLARDYAIAGLDLEADTPLVGELTSTVSTALTALEGAVAGLAGDAGLLSALGAAVLDPDGPLSSALAGLGVGGPITTTLTASADFSVVRSLLDDTISDDAGIVRIDLASGSVAIDLARLVGEAYGTDGLNGLPPNSELVIDHAVVDALTDAVAEALGGWVADVVESIAEALDIVAIDLQVRAPILGLGDYRLGVLTVTTSASLASLLAGTAVVSAGFAPESGLCGIPLVGAVLCGLVNGLLAGLTDAALAALGPVIGGTVVPVLALATDGIVAALGPALDATVDDLVLLLDGILGGVLGPDRVVALVVNAQNDPDPAATGAGPEPSSWAGIPGVPSTGHPYDTGRYDVAALRLSALAALAGREVALEFARSSVGGNVVTG